MKIARVAALLVLSLVASTVAHPMGHATGPKAAKVANTTNEHKEDPADPNIPMNSLPDRDATSIATMTANKDVFHSVSPKEPVVGELIDKFLAIYRAEIARTSLQATVIDVLKAERTDVHQEMQEKELDADGMGIDFVEEAQTQQYRISMLLKYHFQSTMLESHRPYVSVLRVSMDCYNTTTVDDAVELACDVLDHIDLPRRNGSAKSVPKYIQRQIFHSAPPSFVKNHTLNVIYDAVEAQDLALDAQGQPITDHDTMHYVRFRVKGGNDQDCMVVIEHAGDVNTLRYQDNICYDANTLAAASTASTFALTKHNLPVFILIASVAGALVALMLIYRQRTKQRSGYSYLHSNNSKLSHVPTQSTTEGTAVAC